jgi:hypothetical protein
MSIAGKRLELAAAIDAVDGVTGYPYRPSNAGTGDGWPLLGPVERHQASGQFEATWRIRILLPADEAAASQWIDDHFVPLWAALEAHGYIDRAEPVALPVGQPDNTTMYGLEITLRSE